MRRFVPVLFASIVVACGARTGLFVGEGRAPVDAGIDAPDTAPVGCTPGVITLEKARPAVMMILDRSGSMGRRLDSTPGTRWQILTKALASNMPAVDDTMQVGALFYPSGSSGRSCAVPATPELLPALGNVDALLTRMRSATPGGGTPTASAIDSAANSLLGRRAATTARAMVLATDGAPVCNAALDPRTCRCASPTTSCTGRPDLCLDDERTVAAVRAAAAKGLPTYVIGIAPSESGGFPDVLDAMAIAGGRPKLTGAHRFYGADSAEELNAAMLAIRNQVGACVFLTTSVPDAAGEITVLVDGVVIPFDESGMNGWNWADKDNGQIALSGDPCARAVAAAAPRVEARVECSDGG